MSNATSGYTLPTLEEARAYAEKSQSIWNWKNGLSITPTDNGPDWCKKGFVVSVNLSPSEA